MTDVPLVAPGTVVAGRFLIERTIGKGGTGVVYAARHLGLNKRIALKCLHAESQSDLDAIRRFVREAHATARLQSEHVTKVLDAEIIETSIAFIAMEYLDGRDLAQVIEQGGALPVGKSVEYLLQTCEAIAEAHARNIVHRDIKPSNLFLTHSADGTPCVKVLDFGFSKVGWSTVVLTSRNRVLGSPYFMSPEQLRASHSVDWRSDIWSLGAVLYTLITGQCPFQGELLMDVCAAVLSGEVRQVRHLRPEVPAELEAIILRCLSLEASERYQNVRELAEALQTYAPVSAAPHAQRVARIVERAEAIPYSAPTSASLAHLLGARTAPGGASTEPQLLGQASAVGQSASEPSSATTFAAVSGGGDRAVTASHGTLSTLLWALLALCLAIATVAALVTALR
jgi:serine/threonine-protein kinase